MKKKESLLDFITIKIIKSGFAQVDPKWSKTCYTFPEHRIYYITSGNAMFHTKESEIVLEPGYMYLIPAYYLTSSYCERMCEQFYVHFEMTSEYLESVFELFLKYKKISVKNPKTVEEIYHNIITYNNNKTDLQSYLKAKGSLYLLLSNFFKDFGIEDIKKIPFKKSLNYIHKNLTSKISLSDLAKIEGLSNVYFSNRFSKEIGMPPRQYIIHKRLSLSQHLLKNTRKTVSQIAYEVGIKDEHYFCKLFKKRFGITPLTYRFLE